MSPVSLEGASGLRVRSSMDSTLLTVLRQAHPDGKIKISASNRQLENPASSDVFQKGSRNMSKIAKAPDVSLKELGRLVETEERE